MTVVPRPRTVSAVSTASSSRNDTESAVCPGVAITVMATPGHTADSVSFLLDDAVLTADTVLGRGTTVIDNEDGSLAEYMELLRRLHGLGHRTASKDQ